MENLLMNPLEIIVRSVSQLINEYKDEIEMEVS